MAKVEARSAEPAPVLKWIAGVAAAVIAGLAIIVLVGTARAVLAHESRLVALETARTYEREALDDIRATLGELDGKVDKINAK